MSCAESSPLDQVPFSEFIIPQCYRADVDHAAFADKDVFPVVDFTAPNITQQLVDAVTNFGFFQLVNHGVDLETIHQMQSEAKSLFALPLEQKLLVRHPASSRIGYGYGGYNLRFWHEGFEVYDSPSLIHEISENLWSARPDSARKFSGTMLKYTEAMRLLGYCLLEHLATGLGAKPDAWTQLCSREEMRMRLNFYPACPQPSLTLGLPAHFDKHVLTLLHQDTVGGLQILLNGKWLGLRPRANAIIVNVGTALQVLSNGAYVSMKHRVVTNTETPRLSLAYFMSSRSDIVLEPPAELIDALHPPKYRRMTFKEMVTAVDSERKSRVDNYMESFEIISR